MKCGIAKSKFDGAAADVQSELMPFLIRKSDRHCVFELTLEMYRKHVGVLASKPNPEFTGAFGDAIAERNKARREQANGIKPSDETVSAKRGWFKVRKTWKDAVNFAASMASTVVTIDPKTRSLRVLSCHGLDDVGKQSQPPCVHRAYSARKRFHFCNACGCGDKSIARLSSVGSDADKPTVSADEWSKLDYPYLACPIGAPGFSNAE